MSSKFTILTPKTAVRLNQNDSISTILWWFQGVDLKSLMVYKKYITKVWLINTLISITEQERIVIQKSYPKNNLKMTGRGKKAGARKYYILEGDSCLMEALAKLRNTTVRKLKNNI